MDDEPEYECPECGELVTMGKETCPKCGTEFDWDEDTEDDVEQLLELMLPHPVDPIEDREYEMDEEDDAPGPYGAEGEATEEETERAVDEEPEEEGEEEGAVDEEPEELTEEEDKAADEEAVSAEKALVKEIPESEVEGPEVDRRTFSKLGLTFAILTLMALVATIVLFRWDTWIGGASEETFGDRQRLLVYGGIVVVVLCSFMTMMDVLRQQRRR